MGLIKMGLLEKIGLGSKKDSQIEMQTEVSGDARKIFDKPELVDKSSKRAFVKEDYVYLEELIKSGKISDSC